MDELIQTAQMLTNVPGHTLTKSERRRARLLRVAPWLAFFVVALPLPVVFFVLSFFLADAAVWVLLAFLSLGVGAAAGLLATIALFIYRSRWMKRMRQKLAAGGVKVSELDWFLHELTTQERHSLKAMEGRDPLLADAYRETLAMRLTATRVVAQTKKDKRRVEQQLHKLNYLKGADTAALRAELSADHERLAKDLRAGEEYQAHAKLRLQTIEAAAARGSNWADTARALERLSVSSAQLPLSLEAARLEQQALADAQAELKAEG
jgi:hypothetical protein